MRPRVKSPPATEARQRLRLPPYATGTLTADIDRTGYPMQLAGEVPGGLELLAPPGRRFPSALRTGMQVQLAFEVPGSIVQVDARVQQATATYVRVGLHGSARSVERRRRHTRFPMAQRVRLTLEDPHGERRNLDAVLADLSHGGCQLRTAGPLDIGTKVSFFADVEGVVHLAGIVVRRITGAAVDTPAVGVRFSDVPTDARAALDRMLMKGQRHGAP